MASDPPPSDPRHSADHRSASRISPLRAGIVLIGFLVAATVLVAVGTRASVSGLPSSAVTTTTARAGGSTTTVPPTTTTIARSATSVQVANASQGTNLAAHYSAILSAQGWATKPPLDATAQVATSSVYYAAGQQEAAAAIATELKLSPSAVHPLTTAVPVTGASGNDVVVVIGADLAAQAAT